MDQEKYEKLATEISDIIFSLNVSMKPLVIAWMDIAKVMIEINRLLNEELEQSEDEEYDV